MAQPVFFNPHLVCSGAAAPAAGASVAAQCFGHLAAFSFGKGAGGGDEAAGWRGGVVLADWFAGGTGIVVVGGDGKVLRWRWDATRASKHKVGDQVSFKCSEN